MAREHANVRLDMWGDDDWRSLSMPAQWLYELLLTHPKTNRAGVSDWRPNRLAGMARGLSAADVVAMAVELEAGFFIVTDAEKEEILIRSYVKHDGVLKQPNMAVTMANDWAGVSSSRLRAVIAFEVQKLRDESPDLPGWKSEKQLATLLTADALNIKTDPSSHPSVDPSVKGETYPSVEGHATSTTTTTATEASLPRGGAKLKETRLPSDWVPTKSHFDLAAERRVDLAAEVDAFRRHAETHDRHAARWNAAFTTWLKKSKPKATGNPDAWMNRSTE